MPKIVKCITCKKKISDNAEMCPFCGEVANKSFYADKRLREKEKEEKVNRFMRSFLKKIMYLSIIIIIAGVVASMVHDNNMKNPVYAKKYNANMEREAKQRIIREKIEKERIKEKNSKKIESLLAEVKKIPSSDIYENMNGYKKLSELDPSNKIFNDKYNKYHNKVLSTEKRIGKKPIDMGVPYVIKMYLQNTLKDPGSIKGLECGGSIPKKKGWVKLCRYRAKNGFGGYVHESRIFIIRNKRVVESLPL